MKNSGSDGSATPSLAPKARKLFQSAIILEGCVGASSRTEPSATRSPVGRGASNMHPS